jgi:rubrerythrin
MTDAADAPTITSIADLLAVAYRIETDAVERYTMLAEQMASHNNPELAVVFQDLARAEGLHAAEIRRIAGDTDIEAHADQVARWQRTESPEAAELGAAHYLMTRRDALQLALAGEQRALTFFQLVVHNAADPAIKDLARKFVDEETEHVELCQRLLKKYPATAASSRSDPNPGVSQE